jgi:hypothetical protein
MRQRFVVRDDEVSRRLEEANKLGSIGSAEWQSYTWKNELAEQKRRIVLHLGEALRDAQTEHNPYHMLERAVGVAAVCMRRLIECRLVTDRCRDTPLEVHEVRAKAGVDWREPFVSRAAGDIFTNYDLTALHAERRTPKVISDKMLHARVIGVLSGNSYVPDGLLIASDTQSKTQLFHFTDRVDFRCVPRRSGAVREGWLFGQRRQYSWDAKGIRDQRVAGPRADLPLAFEYEDQGCQTTSFHHVLGRQRPKLKITTAPSPRDRQQSSAARMAES